MAEESLNFLMLMYDFLKVYLISHKNVFFMLQRTDVDMIMGSLEGSVCSIGGFCVGASVVMEHQRLSGLGYCFSASLPPYLSEIAVQAIDLFENNKIMFQKLQDVALLFHKHLRSLSNFDLISDPKSPLKVLRPVNEMKGAARKIHNYVRNVPKMVDAF